MRSIRLVVVASISLVAALCWTDPLAAAPDVTKTLSPYFLVEGEESSVDQFPLKSTDVQVSIGGVIAEVIVRQSYQNGGDRPINAKYVFPASTRAAVHGMKMTIGAKVIVAKINERGGGAGRSRQVPRVRAVAGADRDRT